MVNHQRLNKSRLMQMMLLIIFGGSISFVDADLTTRTPSLALAETEMVSNSLLTHISPQTSLQQVITTSNQHAVISAPSTNFTGEAHFSRYPAMPSMGDVAPAIVTFSPNSRTHWHIHHHGQYLIVTEGEGRIQAWGEAVQVIKKGDVIWCPPGVKHWHGASPSSSMTHIAISPVAETVPSVTWLEVSALSEAQPLSIQSLSIQPRAQQIISATTPLTKPQLSLIPIASYTASGNLTELAAALNDALNTGLTVNEIKEAITHLYAYAGFPRSLNGLMILQNVLLERRQQGIIDHAGAEATPLTADIDYYQLGYETMEFVTQASAERPIFDFAPSIDYALKAHLFGYLFSRDNLSYVNRELVTISVLSTLSLDGQLRSHLNVGKNLGISALHFEQIIHVLEPISPQAATNMKTVLATVATTSLTTTLTTTTLTTTLANTTTATIANETKRAIGMVVATQ